MIYLLSTSNHTIPVRFVSLVEAKRAIPSRWDYDPIYEEWTTTYQENGQEQSATIIADKPSPRRMMRMISQRKVWPAATPEQKLIALPIKKTPHAA